MSQAVKKLFGTDDSHDQNEGDSTPGLDQPESSSTPEHDQSASNSTSTRAQSSVTTDKFRDLPADVKAQLLKSKASGLDKPTATILENAITIYDAMKGVTHEFGVFDIIVALPKSKMNDNARGKAIAQLVKEGKFRETASNAWSIAS